MCGYERRKIEAGISIYGLRFYDFIVLILSRTLTRRRAQIAVSVIFAIFPPRFRARHRSEAHGTQLPGAHNDILSVSTRSRPVYRCLAVGRCCYVQHRNI